MIARLFPREKATRKKKMIEVSDTLPGHEARKGVFNSFRGLFLSPEAAAAGGPD